LLSHRSTPSRLSIPSHRRHRRTAGIAAATLAALALAPLSLGALEGGAAAAPATPPLVDPQTPSRVRPVSSAKVHTLVFSDEFNDITLDTTKWVARSWARGGAVAPDTWSYSPANVKEHDGSMELAIGHPADYTYTGAEIDSAGKFLYTFGTLEARVYVPPTKGHLAAVWLNTGTINNVDGSARDGSEMDITETNYASDKYTVTIHWDGYGTYHQQSGTVAQAPSLHSGWHVFGLNWTSTKLEFTYDGTVVRTVTDPVLISQVNEYALLSHEVLDGWADGSIHDEVFDSSSSMYVDYIRVWQ